MTKPFWYFTTIKQFRIQIYLIFIFFFTILQPSHFVNLFKRDKYTNAVKVSTYFKSEIDDVSFSKEPIYLGSKKNDLGYGYEKTTVIQTYYPSNNFSEEMLTKDLMEIMDIYDSIVNHFDSSSYDAVIQRVLAYESDQVLSADEAVEKIKEIVDHDNDMPFGFNRSIQQVEPYVDRDNKFTRITTPKTGKIDYIKKAKEYAEKVKWISSESDSYGYDVLSYTVTKTGAVKELYIEVKTTSSRVDTEFFVSKNEVEQSVVLSNNYCVYRVYDVNSIKPKFYKAFGKIEDNYILDPVTFMAKYKYDVKPALS